jgi:hypothetical protein
MSRGVVAATMRGLRQSTCGRIRGSIQRTRHDSETIGTFYFWWGDEDCLWQIECDEEFSLDDLLLELGTLEKKALGRVKHGGILTH